MRNQIVIITAPDKIYNSDTSILLICPSDDTKLMVRNELASNKFGCRLFVYQDHDADIDWLLDIFNQADHVMLDLDNSPPVVRDLASYFISQSKTKWLTKGENLVYNKLSVCRVYDMRWISQDIGDLTPNEE
jgi:hypothetical protein